MTTFLGCIADDFTGATDVASLLARSGAHVSLRLGVPNDIGNPTASRTSAIEVIALKSRTAPVQEAVASSLDALRWLRQAGAQRIVFKYCSTFDSTPDGNIGPVTEALMAALGAEQVVHCPAFPENGRSVYMGHLFVGAQLLNESPMKDHPLTPMRDANLMRLLEPQVGRPVGLTQHGVVAAGATAVQRRLAELADEGVAHVVVDAVATSDMAVIAEACSEMPLLAGGSAVTATLPTLFADQGLMPHSEATRDWSPPAGAELVLSGSCSAMTRAQVAAYAATGAPTFQLKPEALAADGPAAALAWLAVQPDDTAPLVYATAEPNEVAAAKAALGGTRAGELVEAALAELALDGVARGVRRIVVAGGESSGAAVQALGVNQLSIGPEIAPGVPWTVAASGGTTLALALKSGNFGRESFFSDALKRLDAGATV